MRSTMNQRMHASLLDERHQTFIHQRSRSPDDWTVSTGSLHVSLTLPRRKLRFRASYASAKRRLPFTRLAVRSNSVESALQKRKKGGRS